MLTVMEAMVIVMVDMVTVIVVPTVILMEAVLVDIVIITSMVTAIAGIIATVQIDLILITMISNMLLKLIMKNFIMVIHTVISITVDRTNHRKMKQEMLTYEVYFDKFSTFLMFITLNSAVMYFVLQSDCCGRAPNV